MSSNVLKFSQRRILPPNTREVEVKPYGDPVSQVYVRVLIQINRGHWKTYRAIAPTADLALDQIERRIADDAGRPYLPWDEDKDA